MLGMVGYYWGFCENFFHSGSSTHKLIAWQSFLPLDGPM
uniref:Uncharacterized protein n=1 Tax=Anguilla anguilla TaxID=7936 RepID=A0A0E9REQ7_ANGAN